MSWSKRKRGRLHRTHMKTATTRTVLVNSTTDRTMQSNTLVVTPGLAGSIGAFRAPNRLVSKIPGRSTNGKCHPPKKSATQTAEVVIIPAYSARKKRAKRIELYSV